MGQFRFRSPADPAARLPDRPAPYLTGSDGTPWQTQVSIEPVIDLAVSQSAGLSQGQSASESKGESTSQVAAETVACGELVVRRDSPDSGKLHCLWPSQRFGPVGLLTTSLSCRQPRYALVLELARGTLARVQARAWDWERAGLPLPVSYHEQLELAVARFLEAAADQQRPVVCDAAARAAIEHGLLASQALVAALSELMLRCRLEQEDRLGTLLGVRLGGGTEWAESASRLQPAVNLAMVSAGWGGPLDRAGRPDLELPYRQLQWGRDGGMRVGVGPLIELHAAGVPQWLHLLDSFDQLLEAAVEHVERVVQRLRGKVNLWLATGGFNGLNPLGLREEQLLQLAMAVIERLRQLDDRTPVLLGIDMPWGEYLGEQAQALAPMHLADTLIRADLGISGLALDLHLGYWPGGSWGRDPVEISDGLDRWAELGVPLLVQVLAPQVAVPLDPGEAQAVPTGPQQLCAVGSAATAYPAAKPWCFPTDELLRLLLAKPAVHAISWNQQSDQLPVHGAGRYFSGAGVFGCDGEPRPLLETLLGLRRRYIR
jgi:hypothetical protein